MSPERMLSYAEQNLEVAQKNVDAINTTITQLAAKPAGVPVELTIKAVEMQTAIGRAWTQLAEVKSLGGPA